VTRALLAIAERRADGADVYGEEVDRTTVEFRAGRLHAVATGRRRGCGLRVVKDGRTGFAAGTDPDRLDELVDAAVDAAAFGPPDGLEFPGPAAGSPVSTFDNRVMLVSPHRMVEWGVALADAMRARVPDLVLDVSFRRTYREVRLANSSGLDAGFERAEFELSADGHLAGDREAGLREYVNLSDGEPMALELVADRLEARARDVRRRAGLASGTWPAVILPAALARLLEPVIEAAAGRRPGPGGSPLADREAETVLGRGLTLVDNPLRAHGLATAPFDGDGVPTRRNVLFDAGVFRGFLFDLATGAACWRPSTGSARRTWHRPPEPGASNVELAPGRDDYRAALAGVDDGLLLHDLAPAGRPGILSGDAMFDITSGFRVRKGEVAGRVTGAVTGNVYRMLAGVDAVGPDQEDIGDRFLPFVRCTEVGFAAAGRI